MKKQGVSPKLRPPKPGKNPKYPTIPEISLSLIRDFKAWHPDIRIRAIIADALYATTEFMDGASELYKNGPPPSERAPNKVIDK